MTSVFIPAEVSLILQSQSLRLISTMGSTHYIKLLLLGLLSIPPLGQCWTGRHVDKDEEDSSNYPGEISEHPNSYASPARRRLPEVEVVDVIKLVASDGAANDQFGRSAAMDGNVLVIGAFQDDSFTGHLLVPIFN